MAHICVVPPRSVPDAHVRESGARGWCQSTAVSVQRQQEDTLCFRAEPDECFSRSPLGRAPSARTSTRPALSADCPPCRLGHQHPEGSHLGCILSASLKGGFRSQQSGGNVRRSAPHGLPTRQPYPAVGLPARGPAAQPRHSGPHRPPPHHTSGLPAGKGLTLSLPAWRSYAGAQLFSVPGSPFPGGPVAGITGSEALSCRCLSLHDLRAHLRRGSSGAFHPVTCMRVSARALQGWTALLFLVLNTVCRLDVSGVQSLSCV